MGKESTFIEAFMEKAAANPMGWLKPLNRMSAMKRLNQMKAQKAGTWAAIQAKANSPSMKAKKALGWGLIGTGGAAYGAHQLTKDPDEQVKVPHAGYGVAT